MATKSRCPNGSRRHPKSKRCIKNKTKTNKTKVANKTKKTNKTNGKSKTKSKGKQPNTVYQHKDMYYQYDRTGKLAFLGYDETFDRMQHEDMRLGNFKRINGETLKRLQKQLYCT